MKCPKCNNNNTIKSGKRDTKAGKIQRYYCKDCDQYFTDKKQSYTQYPLKVIMYTLEQYNKGHSVKEAKKSVGKKYPYSPPKRTIYSWINRYKDKLTFLKLRKKYNIDPDNLTTTHNYQHQQIYPFSYHHLKLNIHSKQLPQLRRYINWLERSLNREMFLSGPRCSSLDLDNNNTKIKEKQNVTPELTKLALNSQPKSRNKSPHEIVENFFLINDSTTVCTELPVFISNNEIDLDIDEPITGHIDIVQIRFDKLYILDYKPNLNKPENYTSQLELYKEAINKRTSIPNDQIKTAVFNQYNYYKYE